MCRKELGSLRLKVQCSEQRILESSLYEPFVKLMLGAVDNPTVSVVHSGGGGGWGGGCSSFRRGGGGVYSASLTITATCTHNCLEGPKFPIQFCTKIRQYITTFWDAGTHN